MRLSRDVIGVVGWAVALWWLWWCDMAGLMVEERIETMMIIWRLLSVGYGGYNALKGEGLR